jgi:hypothetical protein
MASPPLVIAKVLDEVVNVVHKAGFAMVVNLATFLTLGKGRGDGGRRNQECCANGNKLSEFHVQRGDVDVFKMVLTDKKCWWTLSPAERALERTRESRFSAKTPSSAQRPGGIGP